MKILRIWSHDTEPDRIHYILVNSEGTQRHLIADRGSALFSMLDAERKATATV